MSGNAPQAFFVFWKSMNFKVQCSALKSICPAWPALQFQHVPVRWWCSSYSRIHNYFQWRIHVYGKPMCSMYWILPRCTINLSQGWSRDLTLEDRPTIPSPSTVTHVRPAALRCEKAVLRVFGRKKKKRQLRHELTEIRDVQARWWTPKVDFKKCQPVGYDFLDVPGR